MIRVFAFFLSFAVLALPMAAAHAQYPSRPITLVVPYTAGSDADLSARNLAEHAARHLNGKIPVMNQPGASGAIGTQAVRNAAPDGHTVPAVRSPQETEAFVRTQFALYFKLAMRLGMRE